ncbi:hypothetical protein [Flavihumibacter profundi]|uniref:hypothetical protein n=1 Tax=Flavihumibacter profundi TaxID=2716883 RepID=UPI001CC76BF3|nr:hypothetical protein [Flavihumibacter profundi]MBZ5856416.1 hypothetical protein [Flavihumibacter profundi]
MFRNIILFLFTLSSCNGNSQRLETPKEFINQVTIDNSVYSKDSVAILADMYSKMRNREASFTNPEYFDSTVLTIDTIMYDSSSNKIAVFVIAKNPTYRNPHSDSKLPYYYNANCYLGKRIEADSSIFELKCLCRFSEINFDDKETIVKALKEDFFLELATVLDEKKEPVFKYNLNDKRFWESPTGWRRMFE